MSDTIRTLTELQSLLADNSSGAISPQDLRDAIVSCYVSADHTPATPAADDIILIGDDDDDGSVKKVTAQSIADLAPALMPPSSVERKSLDYSVSAADSGKMFVATAVIEFTLPEKVDGLAYRFLQVADGDMAIIGNGDIVHRGNASADSVTFATVGQKVGSQVLVECMNVGVGSLRWVVSNLGGTTVTVG